MNCLTRKKKKKSMYIWQVLCIRPNRLFIVNCRGSRSVSNFWNIVLNTIKVNVINGVLFGLLECLAESNSFWQRASILCDRIFLIGCLLCLPPLLLDFFDRQFCVWCSWNKGRSLCKHVPWVRPSSTANNNRRMPLWKFILTCYGKRLPFSAAFWNTGKYVASL